ncbi:MAG: protelomerase family protein, partial [Nostoc sp.]
MQSLEEIKPFCEQFNEWINENTEYSKKSLGTVLSRAGFYKKFKSLPLEQGKNAELVPKHDAQGNVKGNELKHYVLLLCGLDKKDWQERNKTTRVTERLVSIGENGNTGIEIDPDTYLEITANLLNSEDCHKLAVGLIAATGRRPHEILARGKFTPVEGESYQAMFEGQGKKRGQKPVFKISTLFPAEYIIERLARLRKEPSTNALLREAANEFPSDISAQNKSIEDKRGNSLRRVVQEYFGGKDNRTPVLNFRTDKERNDCKALRAACACLVTERDCTGSIGAKMYFAACFLGHITPGDKVDDSDLKHITTSLGYSDYYVTKAVDYPSAPQKDKLTKVSVNSDDLESINQLKNELNLENQQSVVNYLIEFFNQRFDTAKQLQQKTEQVQELQTQIIKLQEQIEMISTNNQVINENDLQEMIQKMVDDSIKKALNNNSIQVTQNESESSQVVKNESTEIVKNESV